MILNRQRTVHVARPPLELFLRRLREQLGLVDAEVAICLVSDDEIARMNQSFRKKKGPTDVLSFPAVGRHQPLAVRRRRPADGVVRAGARPSGRLSPVAPGSQADPGVAREGTARAGGSRASAADTAFLGDIAISPATARRNARKLNRTLPEELQILILHGVLHLLGYDHETDRGQMKRVENRLRRRMGLA